MRFFSVLRVVWVGFALRRRNRALRRRVADLGRLLEAERIRNQQREEALIDRVLTSRNQYGLPDKPLPVQRTRATKLATQALPAIEPQSELERADLEFMMSCAVEAGFPPAKGRRDWEEKTLARRRRPMSEADNEQPE